MAEFIGEDPEVSEKSTMIIVHVLNPDAFKGQGSVILLELADEAAARKVARKIADETGRGVTVRDTNTVLIEAIAPAKIH
ncbi:hypothetical protein [Bradyrhizobium jicamae]|uniref:hypothetical protein n=1 Tax=Bradyrhizobium jicamae TaxID=280332 RepID=UPI001FDA799D|nr:hypothetical protein [Bradyrhizobium jicamae]